MTPWPREPAHCLPVVSIHLQETSMSKNSHNSSSMDKTMNQNNQMSDDPDDGSRNSFTLGKDGNTPLEKAPKKDKQDQSTIEAFGQEGAGVAPKE
jgi:hypothetical protein